MWKDYSDLTDLSDLEQFKRFVLKVHFACWRRCRPCLLERRHGQSSKSRAKKGVNKVHQINHPDASVHQFGSLSKRRGGMRMVPREDQGRGGAIRRRPGRRLGGGGWIFADEASWVVLRKNLFWLYIYIFSLWREETVNFVERLPLLFLDCDFFLWLWATLVAAVFPTVFFQLTYHGSQR